MSTLWRYFFFMQWSLTSKVIQAHLGSLFCQNHCSTFVYVLILIKICMNDNIMKIQFFDKMSPLCCGEVLGDCIKILFKELLTQLQPWLAFLWTTFVLFCCCIINVFLTAKLKMYFWISDLNINKYTGHGYVHVKNVFHIH